MTEILPGIHQVEGVDPSPDFSTHVYLLRDPAGTWTLVDTGLPGSDAAISKYLTGHKIDPKSVRTILITHLHLDHVGSLQRIVKLTGGTTFAHWVEADYIEMRTRYDGPGMPPTSPAKIDHRLRDGERIEAGGGLVAYHTPGHTPGHVSYFQPEAKVLFSGDLFMGSGKDLGLTTPQYTHHTPTAQISARRMAELPVGAVLTYHGGPFLSDGQARIRRLSESW